MARFEYMTLVPRSPLSTEHELNDAGKRGWELVTLAAPSTSHPPVFAFKRALPEPRRKMRHAMNGARA